MVVQVTNSLFSLLPTIDAWHLKVKVTKRHTYHHESTTKAMQTKSFMFVLSIQKNDKIFSNAFNLLKLFPY